MLVAGSRPDGAGESEARYSLTRRAYDMYFSEAAGGRRAGGDLHLGTIFSIADYCRRHGMYCKPDLGDDRQSLPDILVAEPARARGGILPARLRGTRGRSLRRRSRWTTQSTWIRCTSIGRRTVPWDLASGSLSSRRSTAGAWCGRFRRQAARNQSATLMWPAAQSLGCLPCPYCHGALLLPGAEIRDDAPAEDEPVILFAV